MKILFVFSGNTNSPFTRAQIQSLKNIGLSVEAFPLEGKGKASYLFNIKRLRQYLSQNEVDLIHAHYGYCGWVSLLARARQKIVMSFMGNDLLGTVRPSGKYHFTSLIETRINRFLAKWKYDFCIVKSRNLLARIENVKNKAIVPNGVDFEVFYPEEKTQSRKSLGIDTEKRMVLFPYPTTYYEKNYALAKAATDLLEDVQLLSITGVAHDVLRSFYNAADLLLMTSFHEGSPNVVKEAMACNCPIVSVDVGDVKDVTAEAKNCFITPYVAQEIAEKIDLIIKSQKRSNGREKIEHLKIEMIAQRLKSIYKSILKEAN